MLCFTNNIRYVSDCLVQIADSSDYTKLKIILKLPKQTLWNLTCIIVQTVVL
jgi:hypothetical protein